MPRLSYEFGGKQYPDGEIHGEESFEYEVDKAEIEKLIEDMLKVDSWFIEDNFDELFGEYEEQILAHFEDEAYEAYKDTKALEKNPDAYYGVSRND